LPNCQIFATVIGIRFKPNAVNGDMKKVIIVIAVVGRPIPMIPFTKPATKKAKTTIRVISLALDEISKIKLSQRFGNIIYHANKIHIIFLILINPLA